MNTRMNSNSPLATAILTRVTPCSRAMKWQHLATPAAAVLMLLGSAGLAEAVPLAAQVVFGGAGNQQGTGVTINAGNVYYSQTNAATNDGALGRYNGALTAQSWSQALGGSFGDLNGVAVSNSVYVAGSSRPPLLTVDTVGGAENKTVTASIGTGGGAFNWRTQTPAAPGFFAYGGSEFGQGIAISTSAGVDTIYTVGVGEAWNVYSQYGLTLAKLNEAGGVVATATYGGGGIFTEGRGITTLGGNVFTVGTRGSTALVRAYNSSLASLWGEETVTGYYNNVAAFNGDIYAVGVSGANGILSRYNAITGARLWTQTYVGDLLNGIVGVNGVLYAVGSSGTDALLLSVDPVTGAVQNTQTFGGAGTDVFNDIALNTANATLYAIGATDSASLGANGNDVWIAEFTTVPEPTSAGLLGLGTLLLAARRRRSA